MKVIDEIRAERSRQIAKEGWTLEHDDSHIQGEMAMAAACAMGWKPQDANLATYKS